MTNSAMNTESGCYVNRTVQISVTIGQAFDEEINRIKQQLERVTIAKAKAETLGMLNYPANDLRAILGFVI